MERRLPDLPVFDGSDGVSPATWGCSSRRSGTTSPKWCCSGRSREASRGLAGCPSAPISIFWSSAILRFPRAQRRRWSMPRFPCSSSVGHSSARFRTRLEIVHPKDDRAADFLGNVERDGICLTGDSVATTRAIRSRPGPPWTGWGCRYHLRRARPRGSCARRPRPGRRGAAGLGGVRRDSDPYCFPRAR